MKELKTDKINVTISLYFEVKDSEMFGGVGEIGYTEADVDLEVEDLSNIKLQVFAEEMIAGYAKMLKVPKENVRIISRTEYEENMEEQRKNILEKIFEELEERGNIQFSSYTKSFDCQCGRHYANTYDGG